MLLARMARNMKVIQVGRIHSRACFNLRERRARSISAAAQESTVRTSRSRGRPRWEA
jgi:hypothetical protein